MFFFFFFVLTLSLHMYASSKKTQPIYIHGRNNLTRSATKPSTYTHLHEKLQMTMLPHCVGCEWLYTAEVPGVLVRIRQSGKLGWGFSQPGLWVIALDWSCFPRNQQEHGCMLQNCQTLIPPIGYLNGSCATGCASYLVNFHANKKKWAKRSSEFS